MSIQELPDAWDELSSAIRRMLDSTPDKITAAAARLEDRRLHMDGVLRRAVAAHVGTPGQEGR